MTGTHYDVLGVPRAASAADVKRAYRRKARTSHPDYGGTPDAFREVQTAYDILGDLAKRAEYDRALRESATGSSRGTWSDRRAGAPDAAAAQARYEQEQERARKAEQKRAERAAAERNNRYHERGSRGSDGHPLTHQERLEAELDAIETIEGRGFRRWSADDRNKHLRANRATARAAAARHARVAPVWLLAFPVALLAAAYLARVTGTVERMMHAPETAEMMFGPIRIGTFYPMAGEYTSQDHYWNAFVGVLLAAAMWGAARLRSRFGPGRYWLEVLPVWVVAATAYAGIEYWFLHHVAGVAAAILVAYCAWLWLLSRAGAPLTERAWHSKREWFAEAVEETRLFRASKVADAIQRRAGFQVAQVVRRWLRVPAWESSTRH